MCPYAKGWGWREVGSTRCMCHAIAAMAKAVTWYTRFQPPRLDRAPATVRDSKMPTSRPLSTSPTLRPACPGAANAAAIGTLIRDGLTEALKDVAGVVAIRGNGLMIGVELDRPCGELVRRGIDAGILINVTADKVVRLLPPLILNADEARELVSRLVGVIRTFLAG